MRHTSINTHTLEHTLAENARTHLVGCIQSRKTKAHRSVCDACVQWKRAAPFISVYTSVYLVMRRRDVFDCASECAFACVFLLSEIVRACS